MARISQEVTANQTKTPPGPFRGQTNFSAASLLADQREKRSDSGCPVPAAALKAAHWVANNRNCSRSWASRPQVSPSRKGEIPPAKDFWSVTSGLLAALPDVW